MSRIEKLRRLARRLVIESNRLEQLGEALFNAGVTDRGRSVKEWSRTAYRMHIVVTELADAERDDRGGKRRSAQQHGDKHGE